jgi:hypothetical protein
MFDILQSCHRNSVLATADFDEGQRRTQHPPTQSYRQDDNKRTVQMYEGENANMQDTDSRLYPRIFLSRRFISG